MGYRRLGVPIKTAECQFDLCRLRATFKPWSHDIERRFCKQHAQEAREKEADQIALEQEINDALNFN